MTQIEWQSACHENIHTVYRHQNISIDKRDCIDNSSASFICLLVMVNTTVLLVNSTKEEVMWKEKAHHECKVKMDQIWLAWCWPKLQWFYDEDMDGLAVLDDFKVLNINMVHIITMQVDIIMEEVKKDDTADEAGKYYWKWSNPFDLMFD